jgi:hypothetical protein
MTPQVYAKARTEVIALFGWSAATLSPDQVLRVDCAVALRLALDDLQGRVIRGESIDMNRMLTASEALSHLLPPAVLASPPEAERPDPRDALVKLYFTMRERGGISEHGSVYDAMRATAIELAEEIEQAKDAALSNIPTMVERVATPAPAPAGNVGPMPRAPSAPPVPAAPKYDYNTNQDWRDYVEPDGNIRSTPRSRGHDWGPV